MKDVIIYSTPTCHYCNLAKDYFKQHNIPFVEHNVAVDREKFQELLDLTGGMRSVPVIRIGDDVMIGFQESNIKDILGIA